LATLLASAADAAWNKGARSKIKAEKINFFIIFVCLRILERKNIIVVPIRSIKVIY
jgi:hypothetical protein